MGYTHYWKSSIRPNGAQWGALTQAMRAVMKQDGLPPTTAHFAGEPRRSRIQITDEEIGFNGVDDDAHETFLLDRDPTGFTFCKTARKPYDLLATIVMVLAHHHCPGIWEFSSDGEDKACNEALDWLIGHGFGVFANPVKE